MTLGRERLEWEHDVWARIDESVRSEASRSKVAGRILPVRAGFAPELRTVPSDTLTEDAERSTTAVDEQSEIPLTELTALFRLTMQQVYGEARLATAETVSVARTNTIALVEDLLIFEGMKELPETLRLVRIKGNFASTGLLNAAPDDHVLPVKQKATDHWGENTFHAVAKGISQLQKSGHYGPYGLVLHQDIFADTHVSLVTGAFVMPADRIKPLVTAGFYGSGVLPERKGILVSIGGHSVDIVLTVPPSVAFQQHEQDGDYYFRIFERFALRVKDRRAVIRFEFTDTD